MKRIILAAVALLAIAIPAAAAHASTQVIGTVYAGNDTTSRLAYATVTPQWYGSDGNWHNVTWNVQATRTGTYSLWVTDNYWWRMHAEGNRVYCYPLHILQAFAGNSSFFLADGRLRNKGISVGVYAEAAC